jgi:hypothetical protein
MTTEFAKKQQVWKEHLNGKDIHAIWRRVANLLKYDTVWRTYNEARRISRIAKDPSTGLAGSIIQVLDQGFICLQAIEISKLVEKNWDDPRKHLYSLRRLFGEIKNSCDLYTRERYVTYGGISYEKDTNEDWDVEDDREYRHRKYDIISGVTIKEARSKNDVLSKDYLHEIEAEFNTFKDVTTYRHKFLAHAADPINRTEEVLDKITLAYFDKCYQSIIKIGKMLELLLVDEILLCEVPLPIYDVLKNWDKPAVTNSDIPKLKEYRNKRLAEIEDWNKTATLI